MLGFHRPIPARPAIAALPSFKASSQPQDQLMLHKVLAAVDIDKMDPDARPPHTNGRVLLAGAKETQDGGALVQIGHSKEFDGISMHFDATGHFKALEIPTSQRSGAPHAIFTGPLAQEVARSVVERTSRTHYDTRNITRGNETGLRRDGVATILNAAVDTAGCNIRTTHDQFGPARFDTTVNMMLSALQQKLGPTATPAPVLDKKH